MTFVQRFISVIVRLQCRFARGALLTMVLALAFPVVRASDDRGSYDLVVYAGTPGGVACAVRAAREGVNVLLVNHREQLGGMLSDGLSVWDAVYAGFRAPLYEELRHAFWDHYRTTYGEDSPQYKASLPGNAKGRYEARVAARLTARMVANEPRITLVSGYYPVAVERTERTVTAVTFREMDGTKLFRVSGRVFADCSYEGDLMAVADVAWRIGREARSEYGEPHAGRIFMRTAAWPPVAANPGELAAYRRLRLIHYNRWQEIVYPASTGEADRMIQAFNFRTVLSSDPANQWKPGRPENYDPKRLAKFTPKGTHGPMPNQKALWNHPELIDGIPNAYVEGDWDARRRIIAEATKTTLALLYYLQNDPAVPAETRATWSKYGIAKDEFIDHGNMPRGIYVREARRLVGRATFTENNARLAPGVKRAPLPGDTIAITDWFLDVHACRSERADGSFEEGAMLLNNQTWPAQISYRTLLPRDTDNLIVPVCLSASHVGWGAVRLEPTWMHIGESAGYAAALAVRKQVSPAQINPEELLRQLARRRVMLTFFDDVDVSVEAPWVAAVQYLGAKGFFASYWARPHEPLSAALAEHWLTSAAELARGIAGDATVRARALAAADEAPGESVKVGVFAGRLSEAVPVDRFSPEAVPAVCARLGLAADADISRADACALIFASLGEPVQRGAP